MSEDIQTPESVTKGNLFIFLAMLIFGSFALFLRLIPEIPTINFLFSLQLVGAIGFFIVVKWRREFQTITKKQWLLFLAFVAAALLNDLTYFSAFRLTTVANAAFAHQMVSVFLLLFAPWLLKERIQSHEIYALVVAIAGLAVLYGSGIALSSGQTLGIFLGLLSAMFYALVIALFRYLYSTGLSISFINMWRYAISALVLLPFIFRSGEFSFDYKNILPLAGFGILIAIIGTGLHTYGVSKTRALHAAIIGKSEPVIAAIYAFIFLREAPGFFTLVGGALIVGSGAWLALRKERSLVPKF